MCPVLAFCGEPLLLINPSRETFVNFPSAILPDKTITVFLPEPSVPLHQKYPVVFLLGVTPKEASQVQDILTAAAQKAILVGINIEEKDLQDTAKLARFFAQDLIPYINTNYTTLEETSQRALAASGPAGLRAVSGLLAHKSLWARAVVVAPGTEPVAWAGAAADLRVLLLGNREQLSAQQVPLLESGRSYGTHFVTVISEENNVLAGVNLDYIFAQKEAVALKKIEGNIVPGEISLSQKETAVLNTTAWLENQMSFDFIPNSLRLSPPVITWQAGSGQLTPLPGASAGKVKISFVVDKVRFAAKIKLKK